MIIPNIESMSKTEIMSNIIHQITLLPIFCMKKKLLCRFRIGSLIRIHLLDTVLQEESISIWQTLREKSKFPLCIQRHKESQCYLRVKRIFHTKKRLRWLPKANEIDTDNMKCTYPTQTQLAHTQRELYSTGLGWGSR